MIKIRECLEVAAPTDELVDLFGDEKKVKLVRFFILTCVAWNSAEIPHKWALAGCAP